MRLIDADELKKEFPHDEDWEYPVNSNSLVNEMVIARHSNGIVVLVPVKGESSNDS